MSLGSKGLFSFRRRCNTYHRYIVSFRRWNRLYMKHRCWHQYRTHSSLGNLEQRIITILYSKYGKNGNRFSISFWLNYTLELDGFSIKLFQCFLCALWTSSRKPSQALKVLCAGIHIVLISKEQKYQHSPILDHTNTQISIVAKYQRFCETILWNLTLPHSPTNGDKAFKVTLEFPSKCDVTP